MFTCSVISALRLVGRRVEEGREGGRARLAKTSERTPVRARGWKGASPPRPHLVYFVHSSRLCTRSMLRTRERATPLSLSNLCRALRGARVEARPSGWLPKRTLSPHSAHEPCLHHLPTSAPQFPSPPAPSARPQPPPPAPAAWPRVRGAPPPLQGRHAPPRRRALSGEPPPPARRSPGTQRQTPGPVRQVWAWMRRSSAV